MRKIDLYIQVLQAVLNGDRFSLPVNVLTPRVDCGNRPLPTPRAEQTRVLGHHGFRRSAEKLLHTHSYIHTYRHTDVCTEPRSLTGGSGSGITAAHCSTIIIIIINLFARNENIHNNHKVYMMAGRQKN